MSVIISGAFTPKRLASDALHELKLLTPYLLVVCAYILGVMATARYSGLGSYFQPSLYGEAVQLSAAFACPIAFIAYMTYLAAGVREKRPLARIGRDFAHYILAPRGLIGLIVPIVTLSYFISAFSSFKTMIAFLNPFYLDPFLSRLDTAINFGIAPWTITHALFDGYTATMAINIAYNAWLFIMWIYLFCQIFGVAGSAHRARYLLSFVLCWVVLGSILALLLSSAGPCFYGRVTGLPDPYAPLMSHLAALDAPHVASGSYWHLWALSTQDKLWTDYMSQTTVLGSGISAMPSLHLSMACLMALSAFAINRWFGRIMLCYAAIILIGSVHLGWHYAVDGYVSIILTYIIWRISGVIVDHIDVKEPAAKALTQVE